MKQLDIIKQGTISIHSLVRRIKQNKVINKFVGSWTNEQKSQLIEAILLNIPTRSFFAELQLQGAQKMIVGNEEVATIQQFLADEFALAEVCAEINGKRFSEFPEHLQAWLEDAQVQIHLILPSVSDSMIERIIKQNA